MDFFKSVFSDDTEDSSGSSISPTLSSPSSNPDPDPNPKVSSVTHAWTFLKTIASKSESAIENYRRELDDFSSGLRKETAVIREVASRAVKELPASLDASAAVAQRSLESVGEAVDNLGSTLTRIIIHGKESNSEKSDTKYSTSSQNLKPYSRLDAQIRAIQCDMKTYCEEPEDLNEYNEWKLGFILDEKANNIDDLIAEVKEIYSEVVPNIVDEETFWSRYFYKVYKIERSEEVRAEVVKRAISGEEEELTWDVDEEDYDEPKLGVKSGYKDSDFSGQNPPKVEDEIENVEIRRRISAEEEELTWDVDEDDR